MKALKISNMIGKALIILAILTMATGIFDFAYTDDQNDGAYLYVLPDGTPYTIRDPFRQKEQQQERIMQLAADISAGIVLAVCGTAVCILTKRKIKRAKKANRANRKIM